MDNNPTVMLEDTFKFIRQAGCYGLVEPERSSTFQKAIKHVSVPLYVVLCISYFYVSIYTFITDSNGHDFNTLLEQFSVFVPSFLYFTRFCFLVYSVKNVHILMKTITYDYLLCSQLDPTNSLKLYKVYTSRVSLLSTIWGTCVRLSMVVWIIRPIILLVYDKLTKKTINYYPHAFPLNYPFETNEYTYPIIFVYESILIAYFGMFAIFQDVVVVLFITMMCYQFDMLQSAISSIKFTRHADINDRKCLHEKLIVCIKSHQELLVITKTLKEIINPAVSIQLITSTPMLLFTPFQYIKMKIFQDFLRNLLYFSVAFAQIILPCWLAERLTSISSKVYIASYETEWIQNCKEFRKSVLLLGLGSQKPVQLKALGIILVGFNTALSVLHLTYSYFTFLRKVSKTWD